jgi:hypothetical protein
MKVNPKHLSFTHRASLAEIFEQEAEARHLSKCAQSIIAFLQMNNLLNEEAILGYLRKHESEEK